MSVVYNKNHETELIQGATMPNNWNAFQSAIQYPYAFAQVIISLDDNTPMPVYADGGAMIWINSALTQGGKPAVEMDTKCECCDGCKRQCSGESCFMNEWKGTGTVAFSFKLPGDILSFGVEPDCAWKLNAGSFICGSNNLLVSIAFAGCAACCCGGEDPFFTHVSIKEEHLQDPNKKFGVFWAGGYGALTRHEIGEGEVCYLNQGLFFASNSGAKAAAECCLAGPMGLCCGNVSRGLFCVMKFEGPAVVYSQNKSPRVWAKLLAKPKRGKAPTNGNAQGM